MFKMQSENANFKKRRWSNLDNNNLVSLKNITKKFKDTIILKNINLNINKGEVVGIIGTNGCGKTTLLRIIMGFIYPCKGEVIINGNKIIPGCLGNLPTKVDALIENPSFLNQFTGFKNLSLLAFIRNEVNSIKIKEVMRKVGLDPDNKKTVSKYSLGMRQRLGIAQAIMENPSLVLFDEPTNALDTDGINIFTNIVKEMVDKGTSFIIVSHRKEDIDNLCDRVYMIENASMSLYKN